MSDEYLSHRTWQVNSVGATASIVQDVETKTIVPTEIAQLYVLQDIRAEIAQLYALHDIRDLLNKLVDRLT